jgi:hypothetical protein
MHQFARPEERTAPPPDLADMRKAGKAAEAALPCI